MFTKHFPNRFALPRSPHRACGTLLSSITAWGALTLIFGSPTLAQSPGGNLGALLARLQADEASIANLQSTVQTQQNTINQMTASGVKPSGPAGGDLTGTFPSPTIALNAIDHTKFASDTASLAQVSGGFLFVPDTDHVNVLHDLIIQGTGIGITGHGGGAGNNGGQGRAVVDGGPDAGLVINYANDFGLVTVSSNLTVSGTDFRLIGRGGGVGNNNRAARALVDEGSSGLWINYANDFGRLVVNSDEVVTGTMTANTMQITGGSDLAEPYKIAASTTVKPLPGMIVTIDPQQPGHMRVSIHAYDALAGGIISGGNGIQPGITLRQAGTIADGSLPVASVGRVWCRCDAQANGPIKAGDLLTTSDTPGHGMRVTDYNRARGTILGKAMSSLKSGKGLVLVLVSLQ